MKKLISLTCTLVMALMLVLGLGGCAPGAGGSGSAGASGPAQSQAPAGDSGSSASAASASAAVPGASVSAASAMAPGASGPGGAVAQVTEDGQYSDKDSVALYIHLYGHLPSNYISKNKARKAGWVNTEGNLWDVLPGMSIGGSEFYNDDGLLPEARGRRWTECDIDYEGGFRNAKRIVFSDDGLIYYTDDHYRTFEQLY